MIKFQKLQLGDKALFEKFLKPYNFKTCEYSFTNLFIWREACSIEYALMDNCLIIKKKDFNGKEHFMQPLGYTKDNLECIINSLKEYRSEHDMMYLFKDTEEDFVQELKTLKNMDFQITEDRDNFDYVYSSEKLISLSGKILHKKKNHYNYFVKNYEYETEALTKDLVPACIEASKRWCRIKHCTGYLLYELQAIEEILKNGSKLDFEGMVVLVDDVIQGFTIGEKMNDEMAIIHIEKANPEINGLYNFINRTFVQNYYSDVPLINREQDLGLDGLRQAKESYQPLKLEKKFIVS
ncbi:phosphatidylglycerol lysyltransferase domain-containing protein [Clostridium sp. JN-9]|uniref:DUF2156 domain-containing protein n=1 Tax=Clostridium sp. JN-9 TaxID=2507159 RepID=UPI000FFE30B4|nr:phosphatidylglycerol lysyltransferase domain-containing protein [Clostridium sp. JN-9]QAT40797.1 DUF2156 domain-containing protein [Clostridium sp. JN-9]